MQKNTVYYVFHFDEGTVFFNQWIIFLSDKMHFYVTLVLIQNNKIYLNILFQTWSSSNLRVYSWGNRKHYYKGIYFNVKILLWQFAIIFCLGLGEGFCHIFTNLTLLRPSEFTFIVNVFLFSSFWRIPKSSNFLTYPMWSRTSSLKITLLLILPNECF
jgi:hypothetical protein